MSRCCDLLINKVVRKGNNVSKSNRKTKRTFCLNLLNTKCRSDILKQAFKMRINTRTLRTIYKKGGFDEFLKNTANAKLTTKAISIKKKILKVLKSTKKDNEQII